MKQASAFTNKNTYMRKGLKGLWWNSDWLTSNATYKSLLKQISNSKTFHLWTTATNLVSLFFLHYI